MAGKYTHMRYDEDAYNEEIRRSVDPGNYRLDCNFSINKNKCFSAYGPRNGNPASVAVGYTTDVDSVLRGFSKINSKSNKQQIPDPVSDYYLHDLADCSNVVETEYSRYTNPSYELRGMAVKDMRLGYPLHDPQCNIFMNFAENTQLKARDNFRADWQIPLESRKSRSHSMKNPNNLGTPKHPNKYTYLI